MAMMPLLSCMVAGWSAGIPDTGSECMPPGVRLSHDGMNGTSSLVPTFHVLNNVSLMTDGLPQLQNLNDANAIFRYRGLW
jgi:hypothetical protein|eukprot:COSAG06_NODE_5392_length_3506_cov_1.770968_2_plen_80_part_00